MLPPVSQADLRHDRAADLGSHCANEPCAPRGSSGRWRREHALRNVPWSNAPRNAPRSTLVFAALGCKLQRWVLSVISNSAPEHGPSCFAQSLVALDRFHSTLDDLVMRL